MLDRIRELERERAALIDALIEVDTECKFCTHHRKPVPCQEHPTGFICSECTYDCPCRTCQDNSNYEWNWEDKKDG